MTGPVDVDSIEQSALQLQPGARVRLAHSLVRSLRNLSRADLDELWLAEAENRDAEMESGEVQGIPGDEVFARIEARYRK